MIPYSKRFVTAAFLRLRKVKWENPAWGVERGTGERDIQICLVSIRLAITSGRISGRARIHSREASHVRPDGLPRPPRHRHSLRDEW